MRRICIMMLALCFIGLAQAQVGVYRSSGYGAIKKEKVQRPKKPLPTAMIGLTAGGGVTVSPHVVYPNGSLALDFAISATPNLGIGMYTQWGILENFTIGLQMVHGDFINNKVAFVWGVGYAFNARGGGQQTRSYFTNNHYSYHTETYTVDGVNVTRNIFYLNTFNSGVAVKLGLILPKHVYLALDAGIFPVMYYQITDRFEPTDHAWYGASVRDETASTITLSIGYAFGINPKRNKQLNQEDAL